LTFLGKNGLYIYMYDKKRLKNKILIGLLTSPFTLVPFILGATLFMVFIAIGRKMGITLFGAVTCFLGSLAGFFTQLLMGGDKIREKAIEEINKEEQKKRDDALNSLDKQLCSDGDPRTEGYLRDLRAICLEFIKKRDTFNSANVSILVDVVSGIDQLFRECVHSLQQTLEILRLAKQVGTEKTRKTLLAQRENIINDVGKTIDHLAKILQDFQTIEEGEHVNGRLAQIRKDLDDSIEIAKAVDQRLSEFGKIATDDTLDVARESQKYLEPQ
jgi:hypothetical protein